MEAALFFLALREWKSDSAVLARQRRTRLKDRIEENFYSTKIEKEKPTSIFKKKKTEKKLWFSYLDINKRSFIHSFTYKCSLIAHLQQGTMPSTTDVAPALLTLKTNVDNIKNFERQVLC